MLEILAASERDIPILLTICGVILAIPILIYLADLRRRRKEDDTNSSDSPGTL